MKKRSSFFSHLAARGVPAIEMEPNDPVKPTNVETVADVQKIDSDFEGIKTDKKPEDQNLEISKETEIGTEPAFDKEQEDYVAQAQEEGLALEHMVERASRHRHRQWALEDIAEIAQTTLDGEPPLENVEPSDVKEPGISPEAALMVTRALDMDDLGDEVQPSVAIEAFGFDRVAATESFVDRVMNKATQNGSAAGRIANKVISTLQNAAQRVGSRLKEVQKALSVIANDLKDVNASGVQLDPKAISRISKRVRGESSARDPFDALSQGNTDFVAAINLASSEFRAVNNELQTAVDSGDAGKVIAACNHALKLAKRFEQMSDTPNADAKFVLTTSQVDVGTNPKSIRIKWVDAPGSQFSASSMRGITADEVRKALSIIDRADRSINDKVREKTGTQFLITVMLGAALGNHAANAYDAAVTKVDKSDIPDQRNLSRTKGHSGDMKAAVRLAEEVIHQTYNAVWGTVYNLGDGVVSNGAAVRQWGVETLSAGRRDRGADAAAARTAAKSGAAAA